MIRPFHNETYEDQMSVREEEIYSVRVAHKFLYIKVRT